MTTWMKVGAVALAAVVAVFPAFAQLSVAQAVPIPAGEELDDGELAEVGGGEVLLTSVFILGLKLAKGAKLAALAGTVAATSVQKGCQRAAEVTTSLTLRGQSLAQQHPLATRMVGSSVASAGTTAADGGSPQDVVVAAASGALGGLAGHGVGKLPIAQHSPLPVSTTTAFVTGAGFEAIYRAVDPSKTVSLRGVAVAGAGSAIGSLGVELLLRPSR